jgi:hypothetical protein
MDWRGAEETGARQIKERLCALNSIITERASSKRASGLSPLRLRRDVAIWGAACVVPRGVRCAEQVSGHLRYRG